MLGFINVLGFISVFGFIVFVTNLYRQHSTGDMVNIMAVAFTFQKLSWYPFYAGLPQCIPSQCYINPLQGIAAKSGHTVVWAERLKVSVATNA